MAFKKSFDVTGGAISGAYESVFTATKGLRINARYETKELWGQADLLDAMAILSGVTATIESGGFDLKIDDIIKADRTKKCTITATDTNGNTVSVTNGVISGFDIEMRAKEYITASISTFSAPVVTALPNGEYKCSSPVKVEKAGTNPEQEAELKRKIEEHKAKIERSTK